MREEKRKEIKGTVYTVQQMQASLALDILIDLVKMLGPGLAPILSNLGNLAGALEKNVDEVKSDFLGEAVKLLCSNLDKEKTKSIIHQLAKHSVAEGRGRVSDIFEMHFAGKMGELIQWIGFALSAQYDDFLGDLGSVLKASHPQALPSQE